VGRNEKHGRKMIIKSNTGNLEVNKYCDSYINDENGTTHKVKFLVLREISKEDYINSVRNVGWIFSNDKFYEISTD
jgi:hypothetical protein